MATQADLEKRRAYQRARYKLRSVEETERRKARTRYRYAHGLMPKRKPLTYADMTRRHKKQGLPGAPYLPPALCECCKHPPGKYRLALDHDHTTGKFRGWLCTKCNTAIGKLGDTVAGVERALIYLMGRT